MWSNCRFKKSSYVQTVTWYLLLVKAFAAKLSGMFCLCMVLHGYNFGFNFIYCAATKNCRQYIIFIVLGTRKVFLILVFLYENSVVIFSIHNWCPCMLYNCWGQLEVGPISSWPKNLIFENGDAAWYNTRRHFYHKGYDNSVL